MYSTPTAAILGAALYRAYADSSHAPNSLELWIAIADTAVRELQMPVVASLVPWVPIALHYDSVRTDGEFFPYTGAVRVMTGPMTGTLYPDIETAAREVVAAILDQRAEQDGANATASVTASAGDGDGDGEDGGGGERTVTVYRALPSWRFRDGKGPAAPTLRAVPPLIS